MEYKINVCGNVYIITVDSDSAIRLDGKEVPLSDMRVSTLIEFKRHDNIHRFYIKKNTEVSYTVWHRYFCFDLIVEDNQYLKKIANAARTSTGVVHVTAPMPGLVAKLPIKVGDRIKSGDRLVVLEAMKMENEIKSSNEGIVKSIEVSEGMAIEKGQFILSIQMI